MTCSPSNNQPEWHEAVQGYFEIALRRGFTPVPGDTYEEEEDESRVRRDHSPANFNTLRQFALNPPRRDPLPST